MKGFTLVETIVAISVMMLAILGPLAVSTNSLSSSSISTNQIIAYNLAEEGMEVLINKRDSLIFLNPSTGWNDFINVTQAGQCQTGGGKYGCDVDITTGNLFACTGTSFGPCTLHKNSLTGLYGYNSSDPLTNFERRMYVQAGGGDEKQVTVTVNWKEKSGNIRTFTLERAIFNRK